MNTDNYRSEQLADTAPSPHQVLARKWRPRNFEQLVGQEHVLRALINALENNRLHHAYLFTGTRGVGKTTIARILAKCLNCEQGVTANPCGTCLTCTAIDQGRFVDLIEVDAASRTKVEDTRELLDNVQYLPTQGRYKVYLIDEVHMLSGHSFNALLKTLEEPPPHVKFLLATTDPQKLPVTVLSRCLQFHLKRLPPERIAEYLAQVLQQEFITYDQPALLQLGKAADGSMRDALSLLDQAIAYSGGHVAQQDVSTMLGTIEQDYIWQIIEALTDNNPQVLMDCTRQLADNAADFSCALEELLSSFHQIALAQAIPTHTTSPLIIKYAQLIPGEELQLYYQIGLIGRRDLPLAPSPAIGFEMILLRMLSYRPVTEQITAPRPVQAAAESPITQIPLKESSANSDNIAPAMTLEEPLITQFPAPVNNSMTANIDWPALLSQLQLSGLSYTLASHCALKSISESQIHLILDNNFSAMLSPKLHQNLNDAFNQYYGKPIKLMIDVGANNLETPAYIQKCIQSQQQTAAVDAIQNDPNVQQFIQNFEAKVELATIKLK